MNSPLVSRSALVALLLIVVVAGAALALAASGSETVPVTSPAARDNHGWLT